MAREWSRMWASASFVGVLIVIGVPLWWKTTEVFRVSLPYDKINAFDSEAHYITTDLVVLANDDRTAVNVAEEIQKAFSQSDVIKLRITKKIISDSLRQTLDTVIDEQEALEAITATFNQKHNTLYVVQRAPLFQDIWVGTERVVFFRDGKASSTLVAALDKWIYEPSVLQGARSESADAARQVRFPSSDYHVVLSVVNPKPHLMKVEFDAAEAVEDYIGSFVDELSELHNFTLKSQWLYLLDFDFQPRKVIDTTKVGYHYAIRHERLHLLLTKLEERAATHVSELPTVNLALYVTQCDMSPAYIYDTNNQKVESRVQAFMSPKWGGVVLGTPTVDECTEGIHRPKVTQIMGTFLAHLRKLIGITDKESIQNGHLEALRSVAPRRWEVDSLLRIRTLEQVTSAETSLKSLAKLLGEISNIVINEEVGASINMAVQNIEKAKNLMISGHLLEGYRASQTAFVAAETAFMDPSLLALLYFPDDQKYAIYIPLFLPIMFPVILSLKNLILWFRGKLPKEKVE
ncbi:GPI transamidase component PIG-S isoform X1 [Pieris rapae]|uniref:GPI transamidase component PIG-S isoform X1 n=2 Tax=Pieris rapae TaxID=64459 RepID=UPI001E27A289|nr:GPI transamidase component PIG-S isoform X1 [Pieris rapae]